MSGSEEIDLPVDRLLATLHSQAHALLVSDPNLSPEAALVKVAALAVLIYDRFMVAKALRDAARDKGVDDQLAKIIVPLGGATLALSAAEMLEDEG